jgi:hypothetical protein
MIMCLQPRRNTRTSPDSAWPLRGVDGLTFAQRKALTAASPACSPDALSARVVEADAGGKVGR